ncbi:MAG: hypothetical protein LBQ34_04515, partial [Alphaproteobacteria bacterium]|nr:hypothetical protein [Alphaproteobacteria bacterium]
EYSKITNQASSETAGEGVYITVGGKFTNIGSIVANTDKDGNDKGNVISKAGSYEFQNLENIEYSREKGISFDVSVGVSGNEAQDNQHPSGSGTIGLTNKEVESRYETLATIGNGEILVKNDFGEYESYDSRHTDESRYPLSQPNRNIHHTETDKTTYTKHNLDGSLTVDLRFLTQSGREDIWHDLVSYPVLPMWSYYTMGQFDGNYPDLGINIPVDWLDNTNDFFKDNLGVDLELNSWCNEGCKEGYTMGHPVTGMDTYELNVFTPLNFNDYDFNLNTNNLANFKPMGQPTLEDFNIKKYSKAWMYDDHWGMKGVNKVPGAQTWSKAHDWYLTPMNGNKMFGDDQKWTIIPFAIMGTYGGLWGIFVKNKPGIGGIYGKN